VVNQPGRDAEYWPPSIVEVNNDWMYIHLWSSRIWWFGQGKLDFQTYFKQS